MPELPEVETIKRTLKHLVLSKTIKNVHVHWRKIVQFPADVAEFETKLLGQTIHDIERRGKFLKFVLDEDVLISHLRMEGRYQLFDVSAPLDKHTHVQFEFTDGSELRYRDVRKFGTMHLFPKESENKRPPLSKLGVEPLSSMFTVDLLKMAVKQTRRTIKSVLLDQSIIAGLGNIYVDEALFRAGILPARPAGQISDRELEKLHKEIVETLTEAVKKGGSTVRSYVNTQGEIGLFQQDLFVYARKGEQCRRCGYDIEKTIVAGRGTHYCPRCQK